MTGMDKTQVVTIKVKVPTFSPQEAAAKWLPRIMEAATALEVTEGSPPLRIVGASVSGGR